MVDEEERRVARDLGRAVRRVVDGDDEGVRGEPVGRHHLADGPERGRRHDDVARPRQPRARVATATASPMPGVARAASASAAARSGCRSKTDEVHAGQDAAEHREMAPALHARTDQGRARRPADDRRREPGDRDPGHGRRPLGGDRAGVEDGGRLAGHGVDEQDEAVERRQPARPVLGEAGDPLHADEVVGAVGVGAAEVGRHRVPERALGSGMDGDLRRQLGVGDQRDHRPLGEPRGARRAAASRRATSPRREVAQPGPSVARHPARV